MEIFAISAWFVKKSIHLWMVIETKWETVIIITYISIWMKWVVQHPSVQKMHNERTYKYKVIFIFYNIFNSKLGTPATS